MAKRKRSNIDDLPPTEADGKREDYPAISKFTVVKGFNTPTMRCKAGQVIAATKLTDHEIKVLKKANAIEGK